MKHELPIAVGLLAIGCLPWFWQTSKNSEAGTADRPTTAVISPWQQETDNVQAVQFSEQPQVNSSTPSGNHFLRQVANSFASGESTLGELQLESKFLDSSQIIRGKFWCKGHDTRQSRLELILDSGVATKMTQVCDGRFIYRLMEQGKNRQLSFLDSEKLNNEDAGLMHASKPAKWIGTGAPDNLLLNLSEAFEFESMKRSSDSQQVELTGIWNLDHLSKLMINWVDHRELTPATDWSKLPAQFPHGVRMRFAQSDGRWNPTEILFFKFDAENQNRPMPALTVKFGPIHQQSISSNLFRIDTDEMGATDETDLYNERIDLFTGKQRIAEGQSDAIR